VLLEWNGVVGVRYGGTVSRREPPGWSASVETDQAARDPYLAQLGRILEWGVKGYGIVPPSKGAFTIRASGKRFMKTIGRIFLIIWNSFYLLMLYSLYAAGTGVHRYDGCRFHTVCYNGQSNISEEIRVRLLWEGEWVRDTESARRKDLDFILLFLLLS